MIQFAAITPHPPLIIPGIGKEDDLGQAEGTISAMKKLRDDIEKAGPDTIIVISPHAPVNYDRFVVNATPNLEGSFDRFGLHQNISYKNDLEFVGKLDSASTKENIPLYLNTGNMLDHGTLVPLYYLTQSIKPELVHLSFSYFDYGTHYRHGNLIGKVCEEIGKNIAIIASGDLSHRLDHGSPAGYSPRGKEFDETLIQILTEKDTSKIFELDDSFIEEAGECGLRSIIILLGALKGKRFYFEKLSYEAPFGVGYLTARML